jgi:copper chaperone
MNTLGGYLHLIYGRRNIMRNALTLSIEGMHCGGCVHRVTTALQGVDGVKVGSVEVGSAQMTFDANQASAEEIAATVNRIGFSAQVERSGADRHV